AVRDGRDLVVAEVRADHAPIFDAKVLHHRLAEPEHEAALQLAAEGYRVDHRSNVGDERRLPDPHFARLRIDLRDKRVRVHRRFVGLLRGLADHHERPYLLALATATPLLQRARGLD